MTAEDAERFASVLKPMWELDSSPQPTPPPPPKPRSAPPVVTVKPRHVNATMPYPALLASGVPAGLPATSTLGGIAPPPPSPIPMGGAPGPATRDSSHEFDEFVQMPRASAPPQPGAALAVTVPAPASSASSVTGASGAPDPLNTNAFAVEAHLPPRRQQISEPVQSIEVDAPPQALAVPVEAVPLPDDGVVVSFGPTPEELKARAARRQPTMVISKAKLAKVATKQKKSRAPLFIGLALLALAAVAGGLYAYTALAAPERAQATAQATGQVSAPATPSAAPAAAGTTSATAITPSPADSASAAPTVAVASAAPAGTAATTSTAVATSATSATSPSPASSAHGPHKPHGPKTPGGIVRSSPF